ncbi:MAG TPA: hypothetical protein VMQ11_12190 [Alphaproteobacteria bacterium]|nr:hypothetical protein [Alphaproteobacteria bacterium]
MLSQSARASTAKEAAFRVGYPNSTPRAVKLVALDEASVPAVERLVRAHPRRGALIPPFPSAEMGPDTGGTVGSIKARLSDFAGRTKRLIAELDPADLIVLVTTAGEDVPLASVIGEACKARGVPVTALVLDRDEARDAALGGSLTKLRPYASMLVVARGEDYIEEMLAALRV